MPDINLTTRFSNTDTTMQNHWLRCPRYAFFSDGLNWKPIDISHHLTFGQAVHAGVEYLNKHGYNRENIQPAFTEFCKVYDDKVTPEEDTARAPKDRAGGRAALAAICDRYHDRQFLTAELEGKPLVEVYGNLTFTAETSIGSVPMVFAYKIDAIKTDGTKVYVFDYKTASRETSHLEQQYHLDHQMTNYELVMRGMFPTDAIGGVIVNVILMRKGNKNGMMPNGTPAVNVREVRTEIPENMVSERVSHLVQVKRNMLEDAILADQEYKEGKPLTAFMRRPNACFDWGRPCEFFSLCLHRNDIFDKMHLVPSGLEVRQWNAGGQQHDLEF